MLSGGTQLHALPRPPEQRSENVKYLISSYGNGTLNQSRLQSYSSPLRHDWLTLITLSINVKKLHLSTIQDGRGSAPFTETAYRLKYFKRIPKEINQDALTVWT